MNEGENATSSAQKTCALPMPVKFARDLMAENPNVGLASFGTFHGSSVKKRGSLSPNPCGKAEPGPEQPSMPLWLFGRFAMSH